MRAGPSLIHSAVVQIKGRNGVRGSGFFISPFLVATCAHVVEAAGTPLSIVDREGDAPADLIGRAPEGSDLALMRIQRPSAFWLPLGGDVKPFDDVYTFGFPQDYLRGDAGIAQVAGTTGNPPLLNVVRGQMRPGMSGSPLINRRTGLVCGVVKATRDEQSDLGGRAVPADQLLRFVEQQPVEAKRGASVRHPDWQSAVESLMTVLASDKAMYLLTHIRRSQSAPWAGRAIEVNARGSGSRGVASAMLLEWAVDANESSLILTGDFGSGKTWQAIGLAANLAQMRLADEAAPLPVFVPVRLHLDALLSQSEQTLNVADPPWSSFERHDHQVWILDGVDELTDPHCVDLLKPAQLLKKLLRQVPHGVKILFTCRQSQADKIACSLAKVLVERSAIRVQDRTESAIDAVLNPRVTSLKTVTLESLELDQSRRYLSSGRRAEWDGWCVRPQVQRLLKQPFLLRLLEEAIPLLERSDDLDIDVLYDAALRTWLQRSDPGLAGRLDDILDAIALAAGTGGLRLSQEMLGPLVNAGLLVRTSGRAYSFYHHTFGEYLVALHVKNQARAYSAECLARLDLIGSYDINRFLVPMMRRLWGKLARQGHKAPKPSAVRGVSVSRDDYATFLRSSKWRHGMTWGLHPDFSARDGTRHVSDQLLPILRPDNCPDPTVLDSGGPASALSWYDAAMYARHCGGRLPTCRELTENPALVPEGWVVWASDWYDEPRSHVGVVWSNEGSVKAGGANPDFRHGRLTFAIVR